MSALNASGDLDTAGVYGTEAPDPCDCDYAPAGHTEDQCAPDIHEQRTNR